MGTNRNTTVTTNDGDGDLVAVGVGDGVVDADEVVGLGGLHGLDDVIDDRRA